MIGRWNRPDEAFISAQQKEQVLYLTTSENITKVNIDPTKFDNFAVDLDPNQEVVIMWGEVESYRGPLDKVTLTNELKDGSKDVAD